MSKQKVINSTMNGWHFVVVDGPQLMAQGIIARTLGDDVFLVQFNGRVHFRVMTAEQLSAGLLFPTAALMDQFMQEYAAQFQGAPVPEGNGPPQPPVSDPDAENQVGPEGTNDEITECPPAREVAGD
jgi:hypothetical protein